MKNIALAILCVGLCIDITLDNWFDPDSRGEHTLESLFAIAAAIGVFIV